MSFLPENYKLPDAASGYMKLEEGENRFRVLGSAIIGWETWVDDEEGNRKPRRFREKEPIPVDVVGDTLKHFWAFVVWNYKNEQIQILELTQKGIMRSIESLVRDDDNWGDPKRYDIVIIREGTDKNTQYQVKPLPMKILPKEVHDKYKEANINLEALFKGEDPFSRIPVSSELDEMEEDMNKLPFK